MQVKRFLAPNLPQALAQVKGELGEEAVILHTKEVRQPGFWGWFRPQVFEVIAAREEKVNKPARAPKPKMASGQAPLAALEEEYQRLGQLVDKLKTELPQEAPFRGQFLDTYNALLAQGYDQDLAQELVGTVQEQGQEGSLLSQLRGEVAKRIKIIPPLLPKGEPIVIALVGPTGVGKTTTIAKLAALYSIKHGYKVGLATVDTYRIGAVEQLRTYAEILGVPLEVALTAPELKEAVDRLKESCQVILLDTAGRSQQNRMQLGELKSFLQAAAPNQVHLVLSGTLSLTGGRQVVANFQKLGAGSMIVSKLDEVASFGAVASIILQSKLPISYLTCGQAVPDDLQLAGTSNIVNLCLGGIGR